MSEEQPKTEPAKPPEPQPTGPVFYNPVSREELADMVKTIPATDRGIFSSFEDQQSTVPAVLGGLVGLQNKDMYAIAERTNLPAKDRSIIRNMIRKAEHGLGGNLDIPIPYIARQVVMDLRLRVSETDESGHGMSRQEVENIMSNWIARLEAREAEEKKKRQGAAS